MNETPASRGRSQRTAFSTLRQFIRERAPVERCEICGVELPPNHGHLFEPVGRQVICACDHCSVSMGVQSPADAAQYVNPDSPVRPLRRIPRDARYLTNFQLTDGQWDSLLIPVGLAFFYDSTPSERVVAMYPGPAGATESLLSFETWQEVSKENPILNTLNPDVEALLVNRISGKRDYYIAPIDKCYELVGLMRMHWKGLSGGTEVWQEITRYFTNLEEHATRVGEPARA